MKVYVVLAEDRHYDICVDVFKHKESAIAKAREWAMEKCNHEEYYKEDSAQEGEILLAIVYSSEGDTVTVIEQELIE